MIVKISEDNRIRFLSVSTKTAHLADKSVFFSQVVGNARFEALFLWHVFKVTVTVSFAFVEK